MAARDLEVQVKSFGLNAKVSLLDSAFSTFALNFPQDLYVLAGKTETRDTNCSLEFSCIVARCGSDVSSFRPGDWVVIMAPNSFAVYAQVPEWACCKLRGNEGVTVDSLGCACHAIG